jgi:hypothetical protein
MSWLSGAGFQKSSSCRYDVPERLLNSSIPCLIPPFEDVRQLSEHFMKISQSKKTSSKAETIKSGTIFKKGE